MATIASAVLAGILHEHFLEAPETRDPRRPLYIADVFYDWVDGREDLHATNWHRESGGRSRYEHMQQAFADFRCNARPIVGDMRRVIPVHQRVWKIVSPGLRIFGWVPAPHAFVAVCAADAADTHGTGGGAVTAQKMQDVLNFAAAHDLTGAMLGGDHLACFPH